MEDSLKKQFAMRISQANNVQMILVSYEIIDTYLRDAKNFNAGTGDYVINIDKAKRCIEEMMNNLHYEYDIARDLKQLYLYMKKRLRQAICEKDTDAIDEVRGMKNTQSVVAGMTYGKNQILEESTQDISNRGYRI